MADFAVKSAEPSGTPLTGLAGNLVAIMKIRSQDNINPDTTYEY
jgi:hypothetical protein